MVFAKGDLLDGFAIERGPRRVPLGRASVTELTVVVRAPAAKGAIQELGARIGVVGRHVDRTRDAGRAWLRGSIPAAHRGVCHEDAAVAPASGYFDSARRGSEEEEDETVAAASTSAGYESGFVGRNRKPQGLAAG